MKALGLVLVALGVSTADSNSLIIPTLCVFAGTLILMMKAKEIDNEND